MKWERVHVNARARETPDGRKTSGRTGGIWGPGVRWGHTCNAVKGGRYIYVFGGYGADNCQTNEIHVFDTVKQTWCKPMMKGVLPTARDSHSCTTVGNKLFVFGGTDGKSPLKDLHILDTSSNTWITPILQGEEPDAREGHSAALVGKRIFIFGGCGKSSQNQEIYYNDLYILDTEKLIWERAVTSGTAPSARDSHTSSSWENKIIVLGGEDSSDSYLSDVYMLDADSLVWKQVSTSGQMLHPRAGHTTVALGNNLFVFGGFTDDRNLYDDLHVLNIDTGLWRRVATLNQGPSARFSVAGDCLDEWRGILVLIGGCNKDLEALDDMYYLHTDIPRGSGLYGQGKEKFSLKRELKKKCQENSIPDRRVENTIDTPKIVMNPDSLHPLNVQEHNHPGAKISSSGTSQKIAFEGKLTSSNQCGYMIETVIAGKLFRGILFSCTENTGQKSYAYPNKKRMGIDDEDDILNNRQSAKMNTCIHQKRKCTEDDQMESARGKKYITGLASNYTNVVPEMDDYRPNMAARNLGVSPSTPPEANLGLSLNPPSAPAPAQETEPVPSNQGVGGASLPKQQHSAKSR